MNEEFFNEHITIDKQCPRCLWPPYHGAVVYCLKCGLPFQTRTYTRKHALQSVKGGWALSQISRILEIPSTKTGWDASKISEDKQQIWLEAKEIWREASLQTVKMVNGEEV